LKGKLNPFACGANTSQAAGGIARFAPPFLTGIPKPILRNDRQGSNSIPSKEMPFDPFEDIDE